MFDFLRTSALWELVAVSDTLSKFILLVLACMSILCWTLFLVTWYITRCKERDLMLIMKNIATITDLTEMKRIIEKMKFSSLSRTGIALDYIINRVITTKNNTRAWLEQEYTNALSYILLEHERVLPVLRTSADVAPLIGLFGTVWGLINSFMRISITKSADIATVAPGLAEALVVTLAGLMVAIPALVMYNYVHARLINLDRTIGTIFDQLMLLSTSKVDHE
jgi:biopolymer transport protein TolQ